MVSVVRPVSVMEGLPFTVTSVYVPEAKLLLVPYCSVQLLAEPFSVQLRVAVVVVKAVQAKSVGTGHARGVVKLAVFQ